jgi:predicted unusual protein kinase regulating ubiquinone biosynthesis (AarF/ABC1/UbiB family)
MPAIPQLDPSQIEDFIERTLHERRRLQEALADLLAKYDRIPPNNERDVLGRMIDSLKAEIRSRNAKAMAINPHLNHIFSAAARIAASEQDAARAEGLGIWSGRFQMPWDWRREHP